MKSKKSFAEAVVEGLDIAFERLVKYKYRNNQVLVVSDKNGKTIEVSGEDLKKYMKTPIED